MGVLREKMIEEMKLRNFAARTQKSYLAVMVGLAKHYRQFPDQLTQEQIRTYLLHLQERGLSSSSQNVAISGLRFFYQQILRTVSGVRRDICYFSQAMLIAEPYGTTTEN
jgi:integrase/recombinase XerD